MAIKKKRLQRPEELNLVPIMNLVTILIPVLLFAVQFITIAVIDSTLPAIAPPQEQTEPEEEEEEDEDLNLSVFITSEGYTVSGAEGIIPAVDEEDEDAPTVPCFEEGCPAPTPEERDDGMSWADVYDTEELVSLLNEIKDEYDDPENPTHSTVILVPEAGIPYEVLVLTMDVTRDDPETLDDDGGPRELFPNVVIAGGTEG